MEEVIKKGEPYSELELKKFGFKKLDHGIGHCEIWFLNNGHSTWLFRNFSTEIVENIVINFN